MHHASEQRGGCGDRDAGGVGNSRAASSDSEGIHGRRGRAMWLLSQRRDPHRESLSGSQSPRLRRADSRRSRKCPVPVFRACTHVQSDPPLCRNEAAMKNWSRRDFLQGAGALVVSFGAGRWIEPQAYAQGPFATHPSHIDPTKLDSWIAVGADGTVTAFTGKCDFGQGILTAQTQLVAEELLVPMDRVHLIQCDTSVTPDQGTTSGSQSTPTNFNDEGLAQAAATARVA